MKYILTEEELQELTKDQITEKEFKEQYRKNLNDVLLLLKNSKKIVERNILTDDIEIKLLINVKDIPDVAISSIVPLEARKLI